MIDDIWWKVNLAVLSSIRCIRLFLMYRHSCRSITFRSTEVSYARNGLSLLRISDFLFSFGFFF